MNKLKNAQIGWQQKKMTIVSNFFQSYGEHFFLIWLKFFYNLNFSRGDNIPFMHRTIH